MKKTNRKLIGIDIFAGAGGLSLGAELAGISMRYAVECDPHAAASYRSNFKKAVLLVKPSFGVSTKEVYQEIYYSQQEGVSE